MPTKESNAFSKSTVTKTYTSPFKCLCWPDILPIWFDNSTRVAYKDNLVTQSIGIHKVGV